MLGVGGVLAEAVADVVVPAGAAHRARRRGDDRRPRDAEAARRVPRRARGRPRRAGRRARRPVGGSPRRDPTSLSVDVNPLIVVADGRPSPSTRWSSSATPSDAPTRAHHAPTDASSSGRCSSRAGVRRRRRVEPSRASSASSRSTTSSPAATRATVFGTNLRGRGGARHPDRAPTSPTLPDGAIDLVFVCTPAAANPDLLRACAAKGVKAAFLTQRRLRRGGRGGPARRGTSSSRCADELGILLAGPERPGRRLHAGRRCARRSSRPYPPAGRIGVASQCGNFVVSFLNYARADRRRHQPRGVGRQRRRGHRRRLPRLLRRRPRDRGRPRLRRGHRRRPRAASSASAAVAARKPLVS